MQRQREGTLLGIGIRRPGIAHDVQEMGLGQILQDPDGVHDDDGAVSNVDDFLAAPPEILPGFEGGAEKGGDVMSS